MKLSVRSVGKSRTVGGAQRVGTMLIAGLGAICDKDAVGLHGKKKLLPGNEKKADISFSLRSGNGFPRGGMDSL